ncbi:uncharacterized protein SCHCODRAFT_02609328 [Schizophyllum commune H4-8]|uniref:uncharacterized protein n=1 Tax=Schizophyllum commune (strain H4-8 / FGSC 9210) TaxID=578458 RepID=UPI00215E1255|nr:uncharacterized protein SCHCODRAFT_02609328 [Schizophyllum commune H4-8]KAI5897424.1 hypothetical protein SCHCODRAFT_02609328 [Schizophyllum commune H4-8]
MICVTVRARAHVALGGGPRPVTILVCHPHDDAKICTYTGPSATTKPCTPSCNSPRRVHH